MMRTLGMMVAFCLVFLADYQAQELPSMETSRRWHNREEKLVKVAEEGSPCGPRFRQSEIGLSALYKTEEDGKKGWSELDEQTWLVLDESKIVPTAEHFGVPDDEVGVTVFRFAKADAELAPCLRAVDGALHGTLHNNGGYSKVPISGLSADKTCGPFFQQSQTNPDELAFLVFFSDLGTWLTLEKKYTWVLLAPEQEYPVAERFDFGQKGKITLIHSSPDDYQKSKSCLPTPD